MEGVKSLGTIKTHIFVCYVLIINTLHKFLLKYVNKKQYVKNFTFSFKCVYRRRAL